MTEEPKTDPNSKVWTTAAEADAEMKERLEASAAAGDVPSGLSVTPGLVEVPGSYAPSMADGSRVAHVMGPQQAAVDPIAAGLDLRARPLTRNENRVVTQTGELGSGARPATYLEKGAADDQRPVSDHTHVAMPVDSVAGQAPGPNAVPGGEPPQVPNEPEPEVTKADDTSEV